MKWGFWGRLLSRSPEGALKTGPQPPSVRHSGPRNIDSTLPLNYFRVDVLAPLPRLTQVSLYPSNTPSLAVLLRDRLPNPNSLRKRDFALQSSRVS